MRIDNVNHQKSYVMKIILTTILLLLSVTVRAQTPVDTIWNWTPELERQLVTDRENPATWSETHFKRDLDTRLDPGMPLDFSAFPVPDYSLYPGTFKGLGVTAPDIYLPDGTRVKCAALCKNNTTLDSPRPYHNDNRYDCVFMLAVVTDVPADTVNWTDARVYGVSRNHPDITGEGYIKTGPDSRVSWVALDAANGDSYLVANMRLFNLNLGRFIVIVPQTDGSLRSLQLAVDRPVSQFDAKDYIQSRLSEDKVRRFIATRCDGFAQEPAQARQ